MRKVGITMTGAKELTLSCNNEVSINEWGWKGFQRCRRRFDGGTHPHNLDEQGSSHWHGSAILRRPHQYSLAGNAGQGRNCQETCRDHLRSRNDPGMEPWKREPLTEWEGECPADDVGWRRGRKGSGCSCGDCLYDGGRSSSKGAQRRTA